MTWVKISLVAVVAAVTGGIALAYWYGMIFNPTPSEAVNAGSVYDFTLKDINGNDVKLDKYKGSVVMIVNTASRCGYTPQYEGLQKIYEKYKDRGFVVLGFPANNFGSQEPGSSGEIREFCSKNYGVTFQMMEKISVKGKDMHPLYQWLSSKKENGVTDEAPNWNFCKYLVDENGKIIKFFGSKTDPMSEEIISLL